MAKPRRFSGRLKIALDLLLAIFLVLLMSYRPTEHKLHEILGTVLVFGWLFHNWLNLAYWARLFQNRLKGRAYIFLALNLLLALALTVQTISGAIMSDFVFAFFKLKGGLALARQVHLAAGGWVFALAFVHFGLYLRKIWPLIFKRAGSNLALTRIWPKVIGLSLAIYGFLAFLKSDLWANMSFGSEYAFIDFSSPLAIIILKYLAMAWFMVMAGRFLDWLTFKLRPSSQG
ncbi:MAG: hypothetical protein LBI10_01360 [Deltaproteobacteria bacterium]|jgi:hypothetical protein|nr:hypothetical protein [Deltaproteobacteria bacterium]